MTNTPKEFDNCCFITVKVVNLFKTFISENCTITKKDSFYTTSYHKSLLMRVNSITSSLFHNVIVIKEKTKKVHFLPSHNRLYDNNKQKYNLWYENRSTLNFISLKKKKTRY